MPRRAEVRPWRSFGMRLLLVGMIGVALAVLWLNTGFSARLLERMFFLQTVETEAAKHELDPALVLAVIYVESSFNPHARSDQGAVGLMQVMPVTAREIGAELGYRPDRIELQDPVVNIQFGTHYLGKLRERYGDPERALQAYNGGASTVTDTAAGAHPYPETRQFVENVKRWRWFFVHVLDMRDALIWGKQE